MTNEFIPTHYLPVAAASDEPDIMGDLYVTNSHGIYSYVRATALIPAELVTVQMSEPQKLGAMVVDNAGDTWHRLDSSTTPWFSPSDDYWMSWDMLTTERGPVQVRFEGVAVTEK